MMRWDVINHLITKNNYKSYLEIGYYKGWSFDNVKCEEKTAVDPNPCKTPEQESWRYGTIAMLSDTEGIVKMASDDFFMVKNTKLQTENFNWHEFNAIDDKFDIIFIDGLHEAQQVTKDIQNSLKFLSSGGTIVLHDCNPPKYEHTTTGIDGCWTGDVYKTAMRYAQNPMFKFYTVDTDWGVGVLQPREGMVVSGRSSVQRFIDNWDDFDKNRDDLLNMVSCQDFIRMIKDVKPSNQANEAIKDHYSST